MLLPKEIENKFNLAIMQYYSIDTCKCNVLKILIQGFIAYHKEDKASIYPFSFISEKEIKEGIEEFKQIECDKMSVNLVQHYITYS